MEIPLGSVWHNKKDGRSVLVFSVTRPWSNVDSVEDRIVFNNQATGRHGSLRRSSFERDWTPAPLTCV